MVKKSRCHSTAVYTLKGPLSLRIDSVAKRQRSQDMQPVSMIPSLERNGLRTGISSERGSTGSKNIFQNNIWCYLIKTIKWNTGTAAQRFRLKNKKKKKINKSSSSQAGGPSHKESGSKPPSFPDSCNNLFDKEVNK
jgi:hypothetical protein